MLHISVCRDIRERRPTLQLKVIHIRYTSVHYNAILCCLPHKVLNIKLQYTIILLILLYAVFFALNDKCFDIASCEYLFAEYR